MIFPVTIPTYENGKWTTTTFETRDSFKEFVTSCFKEAGAGHYGFDKTVLQFNAEGRKFNNGTPYCIAPFKSKDYIAYWDDQKLKSRVGVIFKNNGKTWYLTRDYYFWINFLPIYDKRPDVRKFKFPEVWDSQYHMALYELLAELNHKHVGLLKKRQFGSSYFHMGKLINQYWFEEGAILKMGASLKDYINEKGSWKFLNEYRDFLNKNTAWYRDNNPNKVLIWQQKVEEMRNGRVSARGLKSVISGVSFEKDPTNSVGGPVVFFFYEEAGIAPTMDVTYEYIRPALQLGTVTTGTFIAAGSVGDLDQCEPLRLMVLKPEDNDIFCVTTNLIDNKGTIGKSGLFIPEHWSMEGFIDEYGNSLVKEALEFILVQRESDKKKLTPDIYQLRISQHPVSIEEAFAIRKESHFPIHLITHQKDRIDKKEVTYKTVELSRDARGKIIYEQVSKQPIDEFPVPKKQEDKTGVICIVEPPIPNAPFQTYFGSVDTVSTGKTDSSVSLCSIYIWKNPTEINRKDSGGKTEYIFEEGNIVAWWTGRFDDLQQTHERLELLIEYYNAWTIVENNSNYFVQHMIEQKKTKYLVPKDQMAILSHLKTNANVYKPFGWSNTGTMFRDYFIPYAVQSLSEELSSETDEHGNKVSIRYGVERIPDKMLLEEMVQYQPGLNVDRLVAYAALMAFVTIQQSNREGLKKVEIQEDKLEKPEKMIKLNRGPFVNLGNSNRQGLNLQSRRSPFKNFK